MQNVEFTEMSHSEENQIKTTPAAPTASFACDICKANIFYASRELLVSFRFQFVADRFFEWKMARKKKPVRK